MNLSPVYIEISQSTLKVLREERGLELTLERSSNGRLTSECRQKVTAGLLEFLQRKGWQPRIRAACAIAANGVSLRRLSLPNCSGQETERLLRLQIESEFPLAPEQLAWGYRQLDQAASNGSPAKQDLLVAAVRKEVLDDYVETFVAAGLNPNFTLAAFARGYLCPQPLGSCAVLDIGRHHSELVSFENGVPGVVRILPWGAETTTRAASVDAALDELADAVRNAWTGAKLYVSGADTGIAPQLARRLDRVVCEPIKVAPGEGRSAAVLGLKQAEQSAARDGLLLATQTSLPATSGLSHPATRKLLITAGALLIALLLLPYAEALLVKAPLEKRLTAAKAGEGRLATIDREMQFLQHLKQNQPPYLDALFLFAKSVPQGAKLDAVTMNRRGDVSIRGSMRNGEQVLEFRSKLIASGFFSSVSVEEQIPTPDRQKVNLRMTAQWKPYSDRAALAVGPTPEEIEKAKTNAPPAGAPGAPPGMPAGMPPGMPVGRPMIR